MKKIMSVILVFSYIFIFSSCKEDTKGFNLQKFNTINKGLLDIIEFADSIKSTEYRKKSLVLELKVSDSKPEFCFSFQESSSICGYIYSDNYRIVGYLDNGGKDIILLSNIDNRSEFELLFYNFITPLNEHKNFNYIFFPESKYSVNEKGQVYPPSNKDYGYLIFKYKKNNFILKKDTIK